jgi:hypothetical protein
LLALIRKLDAIKGNQLFRESRREDRGDTGDSSISTQGVLLASERSRFAEELKNTRYWLIVAAIAIAAAFYFRH